MEKIFINLSNHELTAAQIAKAEELGFGAIKDEGKWRFPNVDPKASSSDIKSLAKEFARDIHGSYFDDDVTIHVMGEMTFVYNFVYEAIKRGMKCVASTSERISIDHGDGTKTVKFEFCTYRSYE